MEKANAHFVVNLETDEFHVNPLSFDSRFAQYAKGDCQTGEIKHRKFSNDFAALVIEGRYPCGHCLGRLVTKRH